ncbi:MAG: hypothetical protein OXG35_06115 [Acidobacteria bacterium]|nr:hypothetical protein [Acidobacteriota bacterium]
MTRDRSPARTRHQPERRGRTPTWLGLLALALTCWPAAPAGQDAPEEAPEPRIEQRVSLERLAIGSTLLAGGLLYLQSAAPCDPRAGCHHEAAAQRAMGWYSVGLGALVLTRWLRVPVDVQPLPRGAQVSFTIDLNGPDRPETNRRSR